MKMLEFLRPDGKYECIDIADIKSVTPAADERETLVRLKSSGYVLIDRHYQSVVKALEASGVEMVELG